MGRKDQLFGFRGRTAWRVELGKESYFDHAIVLFVGLVEALHVLSEVIEFFEGWVEDGALRDC